MFKSYVDSNALFTFPPKLTIWHHDHSPADSVKPDLSQWEATLHNNIDRPRVNYNISTLPREICSRNNRIHVCSFAGSVEILIEFYIR